MDIQPHPQHARGAGVFGAGKSHLLVCVLWFLQRALRGGRRGGQPVRVLFAALTNVAVDNVLAGLLAQVDEGEEPDFVRVGSVRRIAAAVLPQSTHGKLARDDEIATRRELERELQVAPASEHAAIRQAISLIDSGRMAQRARAIKKYTVVGATCAATGLACMAGLRFQIVLLDECSQLTEPASLVPLAKLDCERLLAVGDPMQLPPTLHAPPSPSRTTAAAGSPAFDLRLTLFERLARCGTPPVVLRAQYRCHPAISALASRLFYRSSLVDGLGVEASSKRAPLVPGLPTVGFAHVSGSERHERGSISNAAEASRVSRIVGSLLATGLQPHQLGVICLYRAQTGLCRTALAAEGHEGVVVSTVDAFQGAERDVIIVSSCRTSTGGQLAFIANPQRLNVTITRARFHLLLVGHAATLLALPVWAEVLNEAAAIPAHLATGRSATDGLEAVVGEAHDQEPENEQREPERGAMVEAMVAEGRAVDERALQERAVEERAVEAMVAEGRAVDERALQEGAVEEGAVEEGAVEERAVEEGAVEEGAVEEGAVEDGAAALVEEPPPAEREWLDVGGGYLDSSGLDSSGTVRCEDDMDDLGRLLAEKRHKAAELAAMKVRVHTEMTTAMDTGVRVNPLLAQMAERRRQSVDLLSAALASDDEDSCDDDCTGDQLKGICTGKGGFAAPPPAVSSKALVISVDTDEDDEEASALELLNF